jgi:tRNA uridine 5-carbamoylmethylation protein Kti12
VNKKNSIKMWKSNYIELFGLPGAGKTYVQNKIINRLKKNNLQVLSQKELIIKFYLKNFIINPIDYIKIFLILFLY